MKSKPSLVLLSLVSVFAPHFVAAQEDVDAFTLSPFEVVADSDEGYRANNTLAGSRLNSSLKDVAAPVTVFTEDFLDDANITSFEELLDYAPNIAKEGQEEASNITGNEEFSSHLEFRIRGLPSGGKSYNYFRWLPDIDTYNIDRIDYSRGPNSILFGLGSPSGVLNSSTKKAGFYNETELGTRFSDEGEARFTADLNREIVKDTLAVRLNLLTSDKGTWRDHEFDNQDRAHLALTYQITDRTKFRAEAERGERERLKGRQWLAIDLDQGWRDAGHPTVSSYDSEGSYSQPSDETGLETISGFSYNGATGNAYNLSGLYRGESDSDLDHLFPGELPVSDDSNPISPEGSRKLEYRTHSFFLEHSFSEDLHVEFAMNSQDVESNSIDMDWLGYGYQMDVNEELQSSSGVQANPNLGNYYIESNPRWQRRIDAADDYRLTASYELDLSNGDSNWFGRHRFAGLLQRRNETNRREDREEILTNGIDSSDYLSGSNVVKRRTYVSHGNDFVDTPTWDALENFQTLSDVTYIDRDGETVVTDSMIAPTNLEWLTRKLDSAMFVMQNYWLKGKLVSTFGYRDDTLESDVADVGESVPSGSFSNYDNGPLFIESPDGSNARKDSGITRTLGLVGHPTKWLSLFYNESSNFSLGNPAITIFPDSLNPPNPTGEGEDYGIKVELLEGKAFATLTFYETTAKNDSAYNGRGSFQNPFRDILDELVRRGDIEDSLRDELYPDVNGYVYDSASEGVEFELTANPTDAWRLSLSLSKNETVRSNIALENFAFFEKWEEMVTTGDRLLYYRNSSTNRLAETLEEAYSKSGTVGGRWARIKQLQQERFADQEGVLGRGQREWQATFLTNYRFREGKLKGFSLGGALRWEDANIAGYTSTAADRDFIYGNDRTLVDFNFGYSGKLRDGSVDWRVKLNVKNAFDFDDLQVTRVITGSGDVVNYRFETPRLITLSNDFSF